jgi:hypothetical protein
MKSWYKMQKLKVYVPSQLQLPYTSIVPRELPNSIVNSSHEARRRITIFKSPMVAPIP